MNSINFRSIPCPAACCENVGEDLLCARKEIDTPFAKICVESQVTEAGSIECRLVKTHMTTAEEIAHLQCCSLKLERQLACQIPHYLDKIKNKSHVHYSGPVRAKQACIQYDGCNGMSLHYDLFYVPICHVSS
ncbi:MAG: hypothetical protein AAB323_00920 [Pseudomonadota bacterium]